MSSWSLKRQTFSADGRQAISFFIDEEYGHAKFVYSRWQKYYEPSSEDATSPVVGGLWRDDFTSGYYLSLAEAETDARAIVAWFGDL
ncbi:hypothetical protein K1X12_08095 [Hyphomonas sp. WL0036]|uniref:hypothetical protein n=1 Tax=Hyphomonas sediminis TaxID=2866160 RepID=UPI001C814396|nr:hypothetical protein [Hyphomonas sediminis]MBY9066858.1 hypothetical protein [Hyphomonas sediminis]